MILCTKPYWNWGGKNPTKVYNIKIETLSVTCDSHQSNMSTTFDIKYNLWLKYIHNSFSTYTFHFQIVRINYLYVERSVLILHTNCMEWINNLQSNNILKSNHQRILAAVLVFHSTVTNFWVCGCWIPDPVHSSFWSIGRWNFSHLLFQLPINFPSIFMSIDDALFTNFQLLIFLCLLFVPFFMCLTFFPLNSDQNQII